MADIKRIHDELIDGGFFVGIRSKPGRIKALRVSKSTSSGECVLYVEVETIDRLNFNNTENIINDIKRAFKGV